MHFFFYFRYGRKTSVSIASLLYVVFGPLAAFSPYYWLFVVARVGLGMAGSGVYYSTYTIRNIFYMYFYNLLTFFFLCLVTEFAAPKYRSTLSIFFSVSYPIGMIILALAAYLVHPWRYLQLTISIPAILLLIHYL